MTGQGTQGIRGREAHPLALPASGALGGRCFILVWAQLHSGRSKLHPSACSQAEDGEDVPGPPAKPARRVFKNPVNSSPAPAPAPPRGSQDELEAPGWTPESPKEVATQNRVRIRVALVPPGTNPTWAAGRRLTMPSGSTGGKGSFGRHGESPG